MAKSRIDVSIDEDLSLWIRNTFTRGQLSLEINDYLRMRIMAEKNSPHIEEKQKILDEIEEIKEDSLKLQKELMRKNIELQQIKKIEIEIAEQRKEELRKADLEGEAILKSGYLQRIMDGA